MSKRIAVATALVAVAAVPPAGDAAQAADRICRGRIGPITVESLVVPEGARCVLDRTRVEGNIDVEAGGALQAGKVWVAGNVQADGARAVQILSRSTIRGNVQIVDGGSALVDFSHINGDVVFDSQAGPVAATRNDIGGHLQADKNTGGVEISDNVIDGDLQCQDNRPAPTGGGNIVGGDKQDQCARL